MRVLRPSPQDDLVREGGRDQLQLRRHALLLPQEQVEGHRLPHHDAVGNILGIHHSIIIAYMYLFVWIKYNIFIKISMMCCGIDVYTTITYRIRHIASLDFRTVLLSEDFSQNSKTHSFYPLFRSPEHHSFEEK